QVDGPHRLLDGEGAHLGVVGGEPAVLEHGVGEQVRGGHRHLHAVVAQRGLELAHDPVPLAGARAEGDQVVVVEVDSVGPELRQHLDNVGRRERLAHRFPERVPAGVADRPEPEGELIVLFWGKRVGHDHLAGFALLRLSLRPARWVKGASPAPLICRISRRRAAGGGYRLACLLPGSACASLRCSSIVGSVFAAQAFTSGSCPERAWVRKRVTAAWWSFTIWAANARSKASPES